MAGGIIKLTDPVVESPYHMAMLTYMEIHELNKEKFRSINDNDLCRYYNVLEQIASQIWFKLSKEERKTLTGMFEAVRKKLGSASKASNNSVGMQVMEFTLNQAKTLLVNIDREMRDYMNKYKMIFPKIEGKGLKAYLESIGIKAKDEAAE